MHHADLGLFQYQLRYTVELLGSGPIKIIEEVKNAFHKFLVTRILKFLKVDLKGLID